MEKAEILLLNAASSCSFLKVHCATFSKVYNQTELLIQRLIQDFILDYGGVGTKRQ